jgi:NDP-sugar pyrophosphorylase family protein
LIEALILAGGKAERLGDAAGGEPKPLVRIAGRPIIEYQIRRLVQVGVERVVIACRAGQEERFTQALNGVGAEIVPVGEPEPLGRGFRHAARQRVANGPVFALNGDELLDVDLRALLERHRSSGAAATVVVAQVRSPFGVVGIGQGDLITGFREAPMLEDWVNSGIYVLGEEAIDRLPERGDHETSTFPELAAEGKLVAYKHTGVWLTVNTPKDLRRAEEHVAAHPEWLAA